jgi:hypothetical protein
MVKVPNFVAGTALVGKSAAKIKSLTDAGDKSLKTAINSTLKELRPAKILMISGT